MSRCLLPATGRWNSKHYAKWNGIPDQRPTGQNLSEVCSILSTSYPCLVSNQLRERWTEKATVCQSQSCVWLFLTPWTAARQASLSFTVSRSLLKLMSIKLVIPSNHLILHCPLILLPSIFSSIRIFSNESTFLIRWPKYWVSALASVLPTNI